MFVIPYALFEQCHEKTTFCICDAQLISAFVFAIRIVQSLYYLNPKFQASNHLLRLYSRVCVGPGRKPLRLVFSQRGSFGVTSLLEEPSDHAILILSITVFYIVKFLSFQFQVLESLQLMFGVSKRILIHVVFLELINFILIHCLVEKP